MTAQVRANAAAAGPAPTPAVGEPQELLVVLKNLKRGGLLDNGRHDFTPLLKALARFPTAPAVLALPESTGYHWRWGLPHRRLERKLNRLWPGSRYRSYITQRSGSRNWPGLFIDRSQVTPLRWHRWGAPFTRQCLWGVLEAEFAGHHLLIKVLHWRAADGPAELDREMRSLNQLAGGSKEVLALGDCNATTRDDDIPEGYVGKLEDAGLGYKVLYKCAADADGVFELMTAPLSQLEDPGGWDNAGTQAGLFTSTVNGRVDDGLGLRIDHILTSPGFTGDLVPGTYCVYIDDPEPEPSKDDHRMVSCKYRFIRWAVPPRPPLARRLAQRLHQLRDPGAPPPPRSTPPQSPPAPAEHAYGHAVRALAGTLLLAGALAVIRRAAARRSTPPPHRAARPHPHTPGTPRPVTTGLARPRFSTRGRRQP